MFYFSDSPDVFYDNSFKQIRKKKSSGFWSSFGLGVFLLVFLGIAIIAISIVFPTNPEDIVNYEFSSKNFIEAVSEVHIPTFNFGEDSTDLLGGTLSFIVSVISMPLQVLVFLHDCLSLIFTSDLFVYVGPPI